MASVKRRQRLLETLSSYNHLLAYRQAGRKSSGDAAQWLVSSPEFKAWMSDSGFPVFWCSGKLGSGKTVIIAKTIAHILLAEGHGNALTSFFFCQSDDTESLQAQTILRSIVRQFLTDTRISQDIENCLQTIAKYGPYGLAEIGSLLQDLLSKQIASSEKTYIFIDALDECERKERKIVFDFLRTAITSSQSKLKVFLTSRDSLSNEVKSFHSPLQHQTMGSPGALSSLDCFIKDAISERMTDEGLVIGNDKIVLEVQDALLRGAQGMFLWVVFQLDDLCSQVSDEDIRRTLQNLPRDLPETFNRALRKIITRPRSKIAQQVFRWTAAVKRPLSLAELREAIAIEPCQQFTIPERLLNDPSQIPAYCENLVVFDEEEEIVQFAHHSVKEYLLAQPLEKSTSDLHVVLAEADHEIGEICTTYLSFNDFKTQVIRQPKPQRAITASGIAMSTLEQLPTSQRVKKLVLSTGSRILRTGNADDLPIAQVLSELKVPNYHSRKVDLGHPFLDYASKYWLVHTTNCEPSKSKSWNLWTRIFSDDLQLAKTPWTQDEFSRHTRNVLEWICDERHYALLDFLLSHEPPLSAADRGHFLAFKAGKGELTAVEEILSIRHYAEKEIVFALKAAANRGHLAIVKTLVLAVYPYSRRAPLQEAARRGNVEVVEILLAISADIDAASEEHGRTVLQAAAEAGHLDVVERLLSASADVNATGTSNHLVGQHFRPQLREVT